MTKPVANNEISNGYTMLVSPEQLLTVAGSGKTRTLIAKTVVMVQAASRVNVHVKIATFHDA